MKKKKKKKGTGRSGISNYQDIGGNPLPHSMYKQHRTTRGSRAIMPYTQTNKHARHTHARTVFILTR